jgi:hypothetical protein
MESDEAIHFSFLLLYGLLRGAWHRAALCADPLARNDGSRGATKAFSPQNGSDTGWLGTKSGHEAFVASDTLGCEFTKRTATDIRHPHRYINSARHVRAFGVWIGIAK